jgi:hypothetical protein
MSPGLPHPRHRSASTGAYWAKRSEETLLRPYDVHALTFLETLTLVKADAVTVDQTKDVLIARSRSRDGGHGIQATLSVPLKYILATDPKSTPLSPYRGRHTYGTGASPRSLLVLAFANAIGGVSPAYAFRSLAPYLLVALHQRVESIGARS